MVDKALRHQRHFIEERTGQRDALYQILRTFILASEEIELVALVTFGHLPEVVRPVFDDLIPPAQQLLFEYAQHVAA